MDCSLPGSSVHGILQARVLEWVTIPFFRGPSWHKDWTWVCDSLDASYSVQLYSCVWLFATAWTAARQASLSITNSQTHVHWVSDAIQTSHPLSSPSPPALNLSQHRVFSNESVLHIRWPKYWSFSFNISPSNEHPGLISFRMDWLDLLAVQGTPNSHIHIWLLEKP